MSISETQIKIGDYVEIIETGWYPHEVGDIVKVVAPGEAGEKHYVANGRAEITAIRRYPEEFKKVEIKK